MGLGAMPRIISCVTEPAMDKPTSTSAPCKASCSVRAVVGMAKFGFVDIHAVFALMMNNAARIEHEQVFPRRRRAI